MPVHVEQLTPEPALRDRPAGGPAPAPRAEPPWQRRYRWTLVAVDALVALLAGLLALGVRFGVEQKHLVVTLLLPVLWVAVLAAGRAYESRYLAVGTEEYRRIFDAGVRTLAVGAVLILAFRLDLARLYLLVALPTMLVGTLVVRGLTRVVVRRLRAGGRMQHRVLVTGTERAVAELLRELRRDPGCGFRVVAACVDQSRASVIEGVQVVGRAADIRMIVEELHADTVAVGAWSPLSQGDLRRLGWELEGSGVDILVAPSLTDVAGPRVSFRPVAGLPLIHVEEPAFRGARRVLKGALDRGLALTALVLLAPPMLVIAALVRLTSPGPALFAQTRVGVRGTPFTMLKFRSMYIDAEQRLAQLSDRNEVEGGVLFKLREDPRVTSVGRWLRRLSLDELPQLLNVLSGRMSLVGPRPPLPQEVEKYDGHVHRRFLVKPGITGLWQVQGRSDLSWEESVRLDLYYVENWSPALDLSILWRTLHAVVAARGAY